ncbi:tyrosine-type recombinase/integrase [Pseudomonas sp. Ap32]|nr:tyrosine-type recombinase/integrase [Pseudomonas sp. Ap32]
MTNITLMTKDDVDRLCLVVMKGGDRREISLLALLVAGVRMNDALNLRLKDIQLDEWQFSLKGERVIGIHIFPGFQQGLSEYLQSRMQVDVPESFIFRSRGHINLPMKSSTGRALFRSWLLAAGLDLSIKVHALRVYGLMATHERESRLAAS